MGSFIGHALPGTLFGMFGVWWLYNILHQYYLVRRINSQGGGRKGRVQYQHYTSHGCKSCTKIPIEPCVMVVLAIVGIIGEYATGFENGHFTHIHNVQHMTMYLFFGIHSVVEMLTHYKAPLPPHMNLVSLSLAFAIEGFLFFFHLHGRTPMDVQVHMMLFYVVVACTLSVFFMIKSPNNVMPALCLCYFTLIQGTWFYQIGFVLYPPSGKHWDESDHMQMMWVTLLFTWHAATIFILMIVASWLIYKRVQAQSPTSTYQTLNNVKMNSQTTEKSRHEDVMNMIEDSEEEQL